MEWLGASQTVFGTLGPGVTSAAYIILPSQAAAFTDATLVRTRGLVVAGGEFGASITADMVGAVGITTWDDNDDTVPAAADRPDPFQDTDHDWLWHAYLYERGQQGTIAGKHVEIDSRAMRRLGNNKGVLICFRNASAIDDMVFAFGARCLLKE